MDLKEIEREGMNAMHFHEGVKLKTASGGSCQKPLKSFGDLTFATQYCTGFAINLSANSPPLSRFTTEDPIGLNGGFNLSVFVSNNPIYYIDPLGLIVPGSQAHHPPGWNENWQWRPGSRENFGMNWWDDKGGEWRWHPADKYHTNHWDHNTWKKWNNPWENVPEPNPPTPCPKTTPWWCKIPWRLPPLIISILPMSWLVEIYLPKRCTIEMI